MRTKQEMEYDVGMIEELLASPAWEWFKDEIVAPRMVTMVDEVMTPGSETEHLKYAHTMLKEITDAPEEILGVLKRNLAQAA